MLHQLAVKGKTESYKGGFDSVVNGADESNCNFSLFSTPQLKREWEHGVSEGKKFVQKHNQ